MNRKTAQGAATFGGAAAAVGLSAVIARALCPGGCQTCEACAANLVPAGGAVLALGAAVTGSMLAKRRERPQGPGGS